MWWPCLSPLPARQLTMPYSSLPLQCFMQHSWHTVVARMHATSLQLCPTLGHPMDCNPPGSSVHGIVQGRILESVAMLSSRRTYRPKDQTRVSCGFCIAGGFFTAEPLGKPWHIVDAHRIAEIVFLNKILGPTPRPATYRVYSLGTSFELLVSSIKWENWENNISPTGLLWRWNKIAMWKFRALEAVAHQTNVS